MHAETITLFREHCTMAGHPVPMSRIGDDPSDDHFEVELTEETACYYDAKKSSFGWRVASSIREAMGISEDAEDEDDDDDATD